MTEPQPIINKPLDVNGREVLLGDWVRVLALPVTLAREHIDVKHAFSMAANRTFQVEAIMCNGELELSFNHSRRGVGSEFQYDTLFVESDCCAINRRVKARSRRFQKLIADTLEHDKNHGKPDYRTQP